MKTIYRKYTHKDVQALIPLMAQLGYDHSEEALSSNVSAVRKQGGEVFVAEVFGNVLGCVSAIVDVRLAEGVKGEIVSLVVSKDVRGQGLGKGLVLEAEKWLSGNVDVIRVRANALREQSHLFYESLGYSKDKTQAVLLKKSP
ncbi:GNAT family N-acetyltransferase [Halomonas sp. SpR1]|uniref:GNAT family N-acetyltransferase n=1 Tax=Halomonas sp. SpR1 TaxID=3050462 RepID=UPI0027E5BDC7|nr:GNAT family N-acetyltransferase [Halomonas sp. SpR1]MDQ7732545.1 GNAT family N-acetyltransferase [Halomonas sp. SpR1]